MVTSRKNGSLYTRIDGKVAHVEFGHPASNSFVSELLERLTDTINELSEDEAVSVILLKSEGEKAFCAGASFDELLKVSTLEEGKQFFSGFANLLNAMRKCSKIIIGRVQGKAVGGGVGIIAATDYCFATESAEIKLSELSIGIGPFVIAPAVERKIGISAFSELTLDATHWRTAYWAQKNGLFTTVYEKVRDMDEGIEILTSKLAQFNLEALAEMKKVFWQSTEHWETLLPERAEISGKLALSESTKKALQEFKK